MSKQGRPSVTTCRSPSSRHKAKRTKPRGQTSHPQTTHVQRTLLKVSLRANKVLSFIYYSNSGPCCRESFTFSSTAKNISSPKQCILYTIKCHQKLLVEAKLFAPSTLVQLLIYNKDVDRLKTWQLRSLRFTCTT